MKSAGLKERKELLNKRPLQPKFSLVGYILSLMISLFLIFMGSIVLFNGINLSINGEKIEAEVTSINESDTSRSIIIKYAYNNKIYENQELKYWSDELDLGDKVTITVLKDDPSTFYADNNYVFLSILIFGIALVLIFMGVFEIVKFIKEENRIYRLLKNGEKQVGFVISVEQTSEHAVAGTLPWVIVAKVDDKIFNGCKNYIKFSLTGAVGYLVDIYIDKKNNDNFYIDLISIRRDEKNNIKKVDNYEQ